MIHQQTNRLAGSILQVLSPTLYITGSRVYFVKYIFTLLFRVPFFDSRRLLSTLDFYSRLSTITLGSRHLLLTLDF